MTDEMRALDEFIAGDEPDYMGEVQAPPDAPNAARMLRRLGLLYERRERTEQAYGLRRMQLDAWHDAEMEKLETQTTWLEDALARYHAAVLTKEPDSLNISLPDGDLTSRMSQPEWVFNDSAAFITWCFVHAPDLLRYPEAPPTEIDKPAVKKLLVVKNRKGDVVERGVALIDGAPVVPPGLEVKPAVRKYTPVPKGYVLAVHEDEVGVA